MASTNTRHTCEVEVTFSTNLQAKQALQVLQVDQEPTDRVTKSFSLVETEIHQGSNNNNVDGTQQSGTCLMKVRFESKELKMLRVSVSSFYDYLAVVIKTFQEFDS
ncbi:transcription factor Pcc1 [Nitzschia inconspicua]|uniref:Transcription factor Pcc1 n=1 Tax=Nitzschia inconspicua TaxID=303405 RepID=A0A9K3PUD2_9STRA|nr:transcription factor Pcc1 [Nitzschia inconspicua]